MKQALIVVLLVCSAGSASALTTKTMDSFSNEAWIGCTVHGGLSKRAWLCWDDNWEQLDTSCDLDDSFNFDADPGNDVVTTISSNGLFIAGTCQSTWDPLLYDGFAVILTGGDGLDTLVGQVGTGIQGLYGFEDDDTLYVNSSSTSSAAFGGNDDDIVIGFSSANGNDYLQGEAGNDCLEDRGSGWQNDGTDGAGFDCGTGTDDYDKNGQTGVTALCNVSVGSCL